jgi:hypothetical protein
MENDDDDLDLNIPEQQSGDMPGNDVDGESAIYAEFNFSGQPDDINHGSDEPTDTILYTDNAVASDMTEMVSEKSPYDSDLPADLYNDLDNVDEAKMQAEVDQLADEEGSDV